MQSFKSFKPTPSSGWWGAKMFASAGLLEGLEQEQEQRKRTTFDEDMQAKVYMAAHDAQRQGKRGIGKRAIKIAGGRQGLVVLVFCCLVVVRWRLWLFGIARLCCGCLPM
jgi:hypothetical protein